MNNPAIDHRSEANYAGDYMYTGNNKGLDCFKHINTRQYLVAFELAIASGRLSASIGAVNPASP